MTTETKAPTAEDVRRDAVRVTDAIAAQTGAPSGTIALDHAALGRLKALALLGVQVPGLQLKLAACSESREAIIGALDATKAERSALQARVAELTRESDDWRDKALDRDLQVTRLTSERDALCAQVEKAREEASLIRASLPRHLVWEQIDAQNTALSSARGGLSRLEVLLSAPPAEAKAAEGVPERCTLTPRCGGYLEPADGGGMRCDSCDQDRE
jgi:hypothetical protein